MGKQDKEGQDVDNVGHRDTRAAGSTLCGNQVGSLRHHGDKLNHLHHGQTGLPPNWQRLARLGDSCVHANKVVRVHDGVDEAIQGNGQVNVTVVVDMRVEPVKEENGNVMVNVEKGQLAPLFAQDNKDGVPKIPNLGHVKEPQQVGDRRVHRVELIAGQHVVVVAVGQESGFNRHVGAQHDLRNIVKELDRIGINGRNASQLHDLRPNDHKEKVGQGNVKGRREIRQGPSL